MSTASATTEFEQPGHVRSDPRRWRALAVLGLIQFMLVVDVSIVNVALPRIQHDLGFSHTGLAWVVNGYVLMAGGLLLLGGRLADMFGRKRLFLIGVGVFALASATSGAAASPAMLVSSRFVQGAGEALAAPAALGLIVLLFPDPRERIKAVGIWGGLAGLGGTTGSVISGVLTDAASWRWIFYINLPIALFALLMVPRLVSESRMVREQRRIDLDRSDHRDRGSGGDRLRAAAGRPTPMGLRASAAPAGRRDRSAGRDGRGRGSLACAAAPVAVLHQSHPGRGQRGEPALHGGVLQLHLPADAVRAASAALLTTPGGPGVPAARVRDRRRHGHRHRADAAPRRQAPDGRELPRRRRRAAADKLDSRRQLLRRRGASRDDRASRLLRPELRSNNERGAAPGHRAGLKPGVRDAEHDAAESVARSAWPVW